MTRYPFIPLAGYMEYPDDEMARRAKAYHAELGRRRTVRHYSDRPVAREVIECCIRAAGTAPSGAHRQPWHFVAVKSPEIKRRIREAAEEEEREFYQHRAPNAWLEALAPLGTDEHKPFLETAPYLIVIFAENYGLTAAGQKTRNYYVTESAGIAAGLLISAVHHAGLASLTHTPSPMRFLNDILGRPSNERAFLILVIGHPAADAVVPDLQRKALADIATFV